MEKITKQELKTPDLFIRESSKVAEWSLKHKRNVMNGVIILAGLALLWAGWGFYAESRENKAQDQLFLAQKTAKDNPSAASEALEKVARDFSGTQAGVIASLDYAQGASEAKTDTAISLLEKTKSSASSASLKALAFYNLGILYAAKGDCNKSIDQWNQIEAREDMSFLHGAVFINKGLCFDKLGQKDKAEQMLKKAEGLIKSPEVSKTAKRYLRLLK
jgi:predicted negative regulator of RcsB-dependent stress response